MNRNGDFILVGLFWCRVYDMYFVPQYFHWYGFHHFVNNCPNKSNPANCSKSSGQHKTANCRSKFSKRLYCLKAKVNSSKDHEATSCHCPILIREQTQIQKRTNYSQEKNYSSLVSPEVAFVSAYLTHIP